MHVTFNIKVNYYIFVKNALKKVNGNTIQSNQEIKKKIDKTGQCSNIASWFYNENGNASLKKEEELDLIVKTYHHNKKLTKTIALFLKIFFHVHIPHILFM
jgi:hypothetical protein